MQKTSSSQKQAKWAREYEIIYILKPDIDSDDAEKIASKVGDIVRQHEGKLLRLDNMGKRKLAYPIAGQRRGMYVYTKYLGYGNLPTEIERNLRLLDQVIRFQTVKLRDQVDPSQVEVDPEDVKFLRIESAQEEEEPGIEERLGMVARPSRSEESVEGPYGMEDEEESSEGEGLR